MSGDLVDDRSGFRGDTKRQTLLRVTYDRKFWRVMIANVLMEHDVYKKKTMDNM